MAPKSRVEDEAARARYVCPQCFTIHYSNDVLFAARRLNGRCDLRQAARRYALCSDVAFTRWCGAGETAALLNWRALPQERRQWKDGVISAVRDLDGSWLTRRVCPCCHTPLPPFCPVVFGWGEDGMSGETASGLLYFAAEAAPARWKARREEGVLPLGYDYLTDPGGSPVLGVPAGLEAVGGNYGENFRRRCCSSAAGAVVSLNVRPRENGGFDDGEAFGTLEALMESCGYSGAALKLSVVFLLEGLDQPDAVEAFRRECVQLTRRIEYDFENSYFMAGLRNNPQAAVQAVEWLCGHVRSLNVEE